VIADTLATIAVVGSFATLVTAHVATLFGLFSKRAIGWALGGLAVPPLAPYCAFVRGMPVRGALWIVAALLYVLALAWAQ
jgi:hypothetical protein